MFSARIAACHLFHSPFDKLRHPHEDDLIKLFCDLGKDDTPMVRRAAA